MSFFQKVLARNTTFTVGIVVSVFILDRTIEIAGDNFWARQNRGVSEIIQKS